MKQRIVVPVVFEKPVQTHLPRVAAYARVSRASDAMQHSIDAQVEYYTNYIKKNPKWIFAGVYSDYNSTGTKEERPAFQRLLDDCRAGKIDRIIVKSISRLARNTVTQLNVIHELKELGIGIFFEEHNIDTMTQTGELLITLLAAQAQEESRLTSERVKWSVRRRFQNGKSTHIIMNGYRFRDGKGVIVPEEAERVRRIFRMYLDGAGKRDIANKLNEENIPSLHGGQWCAGTIDRILKNEKYTGDLVLQKTYTPDHLSKKSVPNKRNVDMYVWKDNHEPIIEKGLFDAVQEKLKANTRQHGSKKKGELSELSGLIRCSICGKSYSRQSSQARVNWICTTYKEKGKRYCPSDRIPEETLKQKCKEVLRMAEYDAQAVTEHIEQIHMLPDRTLKIIMKNGSSKEFKWVYPSRSESWTEEMRQKAAEKERARHGK